MSTSEPLTAPTTALKPPPGQRRKDRPATLYRRAAWPRALTGCVSALSMCRGQPSAYRDALKSYGALRCAAALPAAGSVPHDYEALASPSEPGCGCLTPELVESVAQAAAIGDDDIECCGYLGWLHR